jgi:hypothetical protein
MPTLQMSTKLYLVRTHKVSITNIFTALLTKILAEKFYYPCDYVLESKFVVNKIGKFTANFPHPNIRHIIWNDQTPTEYFAYLETCFEKAFDQSQIVGLGCHDDASVLYLSKKYSPYVVTAGVYHTQEHYHDLLRHTVEYHVYNLKNNLIDPSGFDIDLIQKLQTSELVDYYACAFASQNLVPESSEPVCDYNMVFHDIFHKSKVQNFFNTMGLSMSDSSLDFYDSWISQYSDL